MKNRLALFVYVFLAGSANAQFTDEQLDLSLIEIKEARRREIEQPQTVSDSLEQQSTGVSPAPGSGADVHTARQSFLNALGVVFNAIEQSEDKQSVILRYNPQPAPPMQFGLTLTAKKPSLYAPLEQSIAEGQRAATVALLQKNLDDFDDLSFGVAISPSTTTCSETEASQGWFWRCWGKNKPTAYRDLISSLAMAQLRTIAEAIKKNKDGLDAATTTLATFHPGSSAGSTKLRDLPADKRKAAFDAAQRLAEEGIRTAPAERAAFERISAKAVATLIDNQPQFTVNGSYRDPGSLGGPKQIAVSAELQFGRVNVNTFSRAKTQERQQQGLVARPSLRPAYETKRLLNGDFPKDSFLFALVYTNRGSYKLTRLPGLSEAPFTPLDEGSQSALQLKAQWGRPLHYTANGRTARLDARADFERQIDRGVRTKNRVIGTATLTLPVGANFDFPVSLSWANKAEFLGDPQRRFGAHFGLAYKLPWNLN